MSDERNRVALLPCPFCGGEAEIERYGDNRQSTIVACTECGCRLENGESFRHGTIWNTRADAALTEMGGVRVKPLEWAVKSERTQWARARHVAGRYIIEDRLHGPHYDLWSGFNATSAQRFDTLEAAKAAANEHHRARTLAAIEPAPSVRDEGSEMKLAYDAYRKGQRDALDGIRVADPRVILSRVRAVAEGNDDD